MFGSESGHSLHRTLPALCLAALAGWPGLRCSQGGSSSDKVDPPAEQAEQAEVDDKGQDRGTGLKREADPDQGSETADVQKEASGNDEGSQDQPTGRVVENDEDGQAQAGELASANGHYHVTLKWISGPAMGTVSTAEITFGDEDRRIPRSITGLKVVPWMKIHSHGTGNFQPTIEASDPARPHVYTVDDIFFIMSGPWELNVEAEVNGLLDLIELKVEVP